MLQSCQNIYIYFFFYVLACHVLNCLSADDFSFSSQNTRICIWSPKADLWSVVDDLSHKTLFRRWDNVQAVALTVQQLCLGINQNVPHPWWTLNTNRLIRKLRTGSYWLCSPCWRHCDTLRWKVTAPVMNISIFCAFTHMHLCFCSVKVSEVGEVVAVEMFLGECFLILQPQVKNKL